MSFGFFGERPVIGIQIGHGLISLVEVQVLIDGLLDFLIKLNITMNVPKNLTELGVIDPDLDALAAAALADPSGSGNPVEMTMENTRQLLEKLCP